MVAWNDAVVINTAAGYRAFLAKFPDSDLTPTARKLEERLRNRPDLAPRSLPASVRERRADLSLQRAGGAACVVTAEEGRCADQARRSGSAQARRSRPPKRVRPVDDDVVVVRRPPPPREVYEPAPGPSIGIGIGIGGGGGYGGNYGGQHRGGGRY